MLYMTDPHGKKTDDYKKLYASEILTKLQELKDRLNYISLPHI